VSFVDSCGFAMGDSVRLLNPLDRCFVIGRAKSLEVAGNLNAECLKYRAASLFSTIKTALASVSTHLHCTLSYNPLFVSKNHWPYSGSVTDIHLSEWLWNILDIDYHMIKLSTRYQGLKLHLHIGLIPVVLGGVMVIVLPLDPIFAD
jgi:hypothetical protein